MSGKEDPRERKGMAVNPIAPAQEPAVIESDKIDQEETL